MNKLLGRAATTAFWLLILGATGLGYAQSHGTPNVHRDVVSISEDRPPISVSESLNEPQKRKLNKLSKSKPRPKVQSRFVFSASQLATPSQARKVGFRLAKARGWAGTTSWAKEQWQCLKELWQRESGWWVKATNPSSGAYGIPQSLPAYKMATKGGDWRWNPRTQIRWGLGYIKGRYLTPCWAWLHFRSHNWY